MESSPSPPNCSRDFMKILPLLISINWPSLVCTNTHHDVTDLINHGMVKNNKTWISQEQNITFLWNKKIRNLCLRRRILRSYHFVAEVIFNFDYYTNENKIKHNLKSPYIPDHPYISINNRRFWIRKNKCIMKFNKQSARFW